MPSRIIEVQGLDKVLAQTAQLQGANLNKTAQNSMKKALKRSYVPAMRQAAAGSFKGHGHGKNHGPAGRLVKAIDVRVARKRPGEMWALKVGPGGKQGGQKAWYAGMVAGGTRAHLITPGGQAGGSFSSFIRRANRGNAMALTVAGSLVSVVHHPGAKPNNYARLLVGQETELNRQVTRDLIAASQQGGSRV
jgi:hypothetical protein